LDANNFYLVELTGVESAEQEENISTETLSDGAIVAQSLADELHEIGAGQELVNAKHAHDPLWNN
jgi:hypothetical protein